MNQKTYDVVIVGGGIMGSSTAYYLMKTDPSLKVAVIERDLSYARASTTLSLSNVRIQFSLEQNVQISQYTMEVLERFDEEMAVADRVPKVYFQRDGNLFLVDRANRDAAEQAFRMQKELGCRIEWWPPEKIKEQYPLYEPGELVGGTFGPGDGHIDAYAMLMAYKAKARSWGAEYIGDEVSQIQTGGRRVTGVALAAGQTLHAKHVINCAGAWAARIAETAGVKLPVVPVKRQVFALDTAVKPDRPLPLTVLPSGMYFRSETGGLILLGKSMDEDPVEFNYLIFHGTINAFRKFCGRSWLNWSLLLTG